MSSLPKGERLNLRLPSELRGFKFISLSLFFLFSFFLLSEINQPLSSKSDDLVVVLFERERERERENARVFYMYMAGKGCVL